MPGTCVQTTEVFKLVCDLSLVPTIDPHLLRGHVHCSTAFLFCFFTLSFSSVCAVYRLYWLTQAYAPVTRFLIAVAYSTLNIYHLIDWLIDWLVVPHSHCSFLGGAWKNSAKDDRKQQDSYSCPVSFTNHCHCRFRVAYVIASYGIEQLLFTQLLGLLFSQSMWAERER